jgi:hypothetical protein
MHFLAEFTLLSLSIIFVQGRFVPEIKNLNDVISSLQAEQFLSPDKLQQLQNGFFATALTGLNNQWDVATLAQALQQFVTQYIPQVVQMRIEYDNNRIKIKFILFFILVGKLLLNQLLMMLPRPFLIF